MSRLRASQPGVARRPAGSLSQIGAPASAQVKVGVGLAGTWVDQIAESDYTGGDASGEVIMWPYGNGADNTLNEWQVDFSGLSPACPNKDGTEDSIDSQNSNTTGTQATTLDVAPDGSSAHLTLTGEAWSDSCGVDVPFVLDATMAAPGPVTPTKMYDPYGECIDAVAASSCMALHRDVTGGEATVEWCGILEDINGAITCTRQGKETLMFIDPLFNHRIDTEVASMTPAGPVVNPVISTAYRTAETTAATVVKDVNNICNTTRCTITVQVGGA